MTRKENLSEIIYEGNLEKAQILLNEGYDINTRYGEEFKFYPIYSAMNGINPVLALKFVIKNGADVNINYGEPLWIAFDSLIDGMSQNNRTTPYEEDIEMINILISSGAKLDMIDNDGVTPFTVILNYSSNEDRFQELRSIFINVIPDFDEYVNWESKNTK